MATIARVPGGTSVACRTTASILPYRPAAYDTRCSRLSQTKTFGSDDVAARMTRCPTPTAHGLATAVAGSSAASKAAARHPLFRTTRAAVRVPGRDAFPSRRMTGSVFRKLARPFVAGVTAAGALALWNRGLAGQLPINHLAGTPHRWRWRDSEIFAAEAGSGSAVMLLHAPELGGSSYEYRKLLPLLAAQHRAIAFDFLGFGLSEKPRSDYSCELYVEQTLAALDEFSVEQVVLVGSGLAGSYAIRAAARAGSRVRAVVSILPSSTSEIDAPGIARVLQAPLVGESLYNALVAKRSLHKRLAKTMYADAGNANAEVVNAYYAVAHQPGARYVAAALAGGRLDCDVARDLPFVEVPLLLIWGKRAKTNPARNAAEYAELAKRAEIAYFVRSAMLPHDEEAQAVAERIEHFLGA
jgi:pimeloyl-ACP methyl ester carboxylesterase